MDLKLTADDIAFRDEVRAFFAEHVTDDMRRAMKLTTGFINDPPVGKELHKALYAKGWAAPNWPVEFGGTGWTPVQRYIYESEYALAGAPRFNDQGTRHIGPILMKYGAKEQLEKYLPAILSGDDVWCQGYSEPGSGSDLASLKTKAEDKGDHYLVNGQKIWTTHAQFSNRIYALVRTSSEGKKQAGITFLVMDMGLPGMTVRPIRGSGGDHEFNEVFFEDVRAPKTGLIGEENQGWEIAKYLLEYERGGNPQAARARSKFSAIAKLLKSRSPGDEELTARLAEIGMDIDAMEMLELTLLSALQSGKNPGAVSSHLKLRWSTLQQEIAELALDALGVDGLRWQAERPLYDHLQLAPEDEELLGYGPRYLNYRAYTILGGTSEIQKGILAKVMLGL